MSEASQNLSLILEYIVGFSQNLVCLLPVRSPDILLNYPPINTPTVSLQIELKSQFVIMEAQGRQDVRGVHAGPDAVEYAKLVAPYDILDPMYCISPQVVDEHQ